MHSKEKGHQHFLDVCYPPCIDRGSQDSVFHISIKCLFSEIVIIMRTKQVLGVAQDGRCIFHCMWVSKLACKLQLAHSKWHRNMTGFPINTNEMLDENRYEEELKSAKLMAQPYVDALKARGNEDLANKYEHGHVHVEGCATLNDIAAECKVFINVHHGSVFGALEFHR